MQHRARQPSSVISSIAKATPPAKSKAARIESNTNKPKDFKQAQTSAPRDKNTDQHIVINPDPWSPLQLYSIYRLVLAGILLIITLSNVIPIQIGAYDPDVFTQAANSYVLFAISGIFLTHFRWPAFSIQVYFHSATDIVFLLAIIYASGGLSSGLSILILLPVILPSVLKPGQGSLFLSAMTVICLLGIQFYWESMSAGGANDASQMMHTGILALFIMTISWMAGVWFEKASLTAELAKRRGIDLANLSQLNQSILDQLETGIIVLEHSGRIRHMNPSSWDMLGQPEDWRERNLGEFAPELNAHLKIWIENICPKVASFDIKHRKTTEITIRLSQLGSRDKGVVLMYLEDTSAQREKQQGIKMASLGQLTANIAHEIRNPLGAISHAAQLLSESEALDKTENRMVQIIQSNSVRMNTTIQSVLNVSRKKNPRRETLVLKAWLQEFINDFVMQSTLQKHQISLFIEPSNAEIQFDPEHLQQVLWNLCRNAEKYARENVADLHIDIQGSHPLHTRDIMLNIMDNGKGIPDQNIDRLFEPFYTTSTRGTGLGLFMARELCLSNSASLDYVKLPAGGSCFRLIFSHARLNEK